MRGNAGSAATVAAARVELPTRLPRLAGHRLRWRVTRLLRHTVHGLEDEHGELSAYLVRIQIRGLDRPAEPRRRVPGTSLVHHQRDDVIRTLLTGAKLRLLLRELRVDVANGAFERAFHPASGSGWRSRTIVPVKVDPVVPVSSTL